MNLSFIALPNTVREIPDSAFEGCTDLLSFVMTNNVVTIGENAFKNCTNLKFVYLSESLSEIGAHAFEDCTSLKGIHFPDGLETIGDYAFAGCTSLLAINFNDNLTNIGDYAFKNIGGTGWSEKRMRYGHGDPILTPESQNGDFYIDVNTGELYIRQNDIWRKGKITVTVTSLGTWLEDDEGNDGDFWADEYQTNTYNMYVKLNGRWEEANMTCYLGHGAPTIVNNRNGYWYIDLDTEDLYVSCDGVWEKGKLAPIVVGNETYYDYYEDDSHSYNEDCEYYIDTTFSEDIGWSSSSGKTSLTFIASSGEGMGSGAWYLRVLPGHGVPVAQEGDKYIDLDSGSIYEYDGYYWDYASSVVVASGHGAPASGAIDTYYFDLDSSKLYYKDGKCLSSITFPDNLQTIGLGAFEGCNGLETITLPFVGGSIKNKGESTDFDTYYTVFGHIFGTDYDYEQNDYVPASLKKVVVTKGNQFSGYDEWEETTMNDCRIPHGAFKNCANIETIVIPETVTYIGTTAFKDCAALKNIIFEGQTRIRSFQDNTFSGCSSLESFVTPASVEYIKHGSFSNCTSLKYFTYEENSKINSLYPGVFAGCSSLESYIEPDSCVDNIYYICTDGNPIFDGCTSMKNMVIKGEFFVSTNNPSHLPYDMNATNRSPTSSDRGHDGHYWLNTSTYDLYMYYGPRVGGSWQYVGSIKTSNSCTVHVNNATNPVDGDVLIFVEGGKTTHPYYQIRKNGQWVNKNYRIIGFGWLFGDSSNATLPDSLKSVTIGGNRAIDYKFFAYAQSIENIVLKDTVTSISEESFSGCYSLVSVTLSNSITSIPSNAFDYCYSLESIVIPDGVTSIGEEAFTDCTSLESIVIPDSVISIGDSAFEDCDSLKYVKLSDNLASLGMSAFYSCDSLESITIPGTLTSIGGNAFADIMALKTVVISDGVTSIGSSAFYWCTNLEYVITPDTLESIGAGAFSGCIALKSFVIPDGATDIGRGAFMDCTSLQSIVVPNSVTSIGEKVFEGTDLESLTIPFITTLDNILRYNDTLKTLEITGDGTFSTGVFAGSYCPIETLIISGNQTIEPGAFSQIGYVDSENHLEKIVLRNVSPTSSTYFYNYFGSYASAVPSTLKTVEILEGITSIKEKAFYNCNNLETIVIPEDVYDIANSAFENCSSLVNLKLPSGVETISSRTFYGCTSLTGLNLNNVTDVGSYSFYNCSALKDVDLRNITNIYEHAFEGCASLEKAILSNNLESIGASAFKGCSSLVFVNGGADSYCHIEDETFKDCESLSYVYIKNMGDIGNSAFSGCHALRNIIFDDGAYEIGDSAFAYCKSLASIVLPESLFKIGDNAFMSCEGLASIIIPEQVHSIGDSAFKGCKSLKNLIIPKDLDDIGEGALEDCDSLESLSVPNLFTSSSSFYMSQLFNGVPQSLKTVTFTGYHDLDNYVTSALGSVETLIINVGGEIGDDAFENCTGLRRVVIGVDVTMIGASAFRDCSNLESINFPSSIQTIRSHAFEGCKKLERVNLVSVETIEDSAFYNCTSLIYVNLGNRLENISDYTFMGCSSLSQVIIPDCLEEIGKSAFSNCYSLTLFNFKDVEKIGNAAFYKCSSLMTISLNITKLTTIGADAFTSCTSISTIIVRGATGANYAAKVTSYQTWYNNYGGGNIMLQYNEESGVNLIFRY